MLNICWRAGAIQLLYSRCTANREDCARLDVAADNFWGNNRQRALFDIRVFNPHAPSYQNIPLAVCYRMKMNGRRKEHYEQRVRESEHGSFSPLVFSTTGGMGAIATVVYKRLATMIAKKQEKSYNHRYYGTTKSSS